MKNSKKQDSDDWDKQQQSQTRKPKQPLNPKSTPGRRNYTQDSAYKQQQSQPNKSSNKSDLSLSMTQIKQQNTSNIQHQPRNIQKVPLSTVTQSQQKKNSGDQWEECQPNSAQQKQQKQSNRDSKIVKSASDKQENNSGKKVQKQQQQQKDKADNDDDDDWDKHDNILDQLKKQQQQYDPKQPQQSYSIMHKQPKELQIDENKQMDTSWQKQAQIITQQTPKIQSRRGNRRNDDQDNNNNDNRWSNSNNGGGSSGGRGSQRGNRDNNNDNNNNNNNGFQRSDGFKKKQNPYQDSNGNNNNGSNGYARGDRDTRGNRDDRGQRGDRGDRDGNNYNRNGWDRNNNNNGQGYRGRGRGGFGGNNRGGYQNNQGSGFRDRRQNNQYRPRGGNYNRGFNNNNDDRDSQRGNRQQYEHTNRNYNNNNYGRGNRDNREDNYQRRDNQANDNYKFAVQNQRKARQLYQRNEREAERAQKQVKKQPETTSKKQQPSAQTIVTSKMTILPRGQKCWPQMSIYIMGTKLTFSYRQITEHQCDILIIPYKDLKLQIYPGNIVNKCKADYRRKMTEKGAEIQEVGYLYPQKCVGIQNFKAFGFLKLGKSAQQIKTCFAGIIPKLKLLKMSVSTILIPYSKQLGNSRQFIKTIIESLAKNTGFTEVHISTNNGTDFRSGMTSFVQEVESFIQDNKICIDF